ncbi:MAG TPA: hypothetical protein VJP59_00295 [Gemmatimonadota bacterium]|nr:hypothetical protein [Gemmatimonadota bacterium]
MVPVAGGAALVVVYGVTLHAPAMGLYHDDGIYVVMAKALAEGHGYRLISLPDEIPQTKYPVLFPLGLSMIWRISPPFPANVLYLKLLPLAAAIVWLWLVNRFLAYQTGRPTLARGITLLTAASPSIVFFSTILLAETLFAAFAWGGVWMLTRCERESPTGPRLVWASLLCAAAYHTRTLGFTLIVAGIVGLAIKKRFRAAVLFGSLSGVLALPWLLWTWSQAGVPELYAYYTSSNYKDWNVLFGFPVAQKLTIVSWNALFLLVEPGRLIGFTSGMIWPLLVVIGMLIAIGFLACARRGPGVVHLFAATYVGTLLLWAWPPARFLLPVYPLLLLYAAVGGLTVLDRWTRPGLRTAIVTTAIALAAFVAGWGSGTIARKAVDKGRGCLGDPCARGWQDFRQMMSWLEERTPPGATLMGTQDPMLYMYTGRKALRAYHPDPALLHYSADPDREPFGPPERMAERMADSAAEHLVLTRRDVGLEDTFLWRQFLALRSVRPLLLESEMTIGSPDFGVYKIDQGALVRP